jgi:Amt family ammonium transporter
MVINGILAGLVAITAGCNMEEPLTEIINGTVAGVLVDVAVIYVDKLKVDDPVGAVAVHGVNGFFGTLAVGLFAADGGLFFGGGFSLLLTQLIGVITIAVFSFVVTFVLMKLIDKTLGIRVSREEEIAGIDAASFGVESYSTYE